MKTAVVRGDLYRDRWSSYGEHTGIRKISGMLSPDELRQFEIFADLSDKFLEQVSQDISVAQWKHGATLFEEGSYLDLAFYVVSGEVDLFLAKHGNAAEPIFSADREVDARTAIAPSSPELRSSPPATRAVRAGTGGPPANVTYLATMDFDLATGETQRLGKGEVFGEIGALNGWPQSVTARTVTPCTLVQIRLPALRQLKRKAKKLSEQIDRTYRERTLLHHLTTTPVLRGCADEAVRGLAQKVELVSLEPDEPLAKEGEAADALFLVRSGFVKLSQSLGEGDIVVTYLSKGMTLGDVELLLDELNTWQVSAASVGYSELVRISAQDFRDVISANPSVERRLWESAVERIRKSGYTRRDPRRAELVEFSLAKGLVQGNSVLVMDLDVCTRCDDCVRGCASTHGGRPRFVREGERFGDLLIARSCYHCEDPVCLVGCPTGAIRRANVAEVVAVDDNLCIGCGTCAENCPYDAIVMHETGNTWPDDALPERLRGEARFVASKCDLCYESEAGPACVSSCPHSCAFRISSLDEFEALLHQRDIPRATAER